MTTIHLTLLQHQVLQTIGDLMLQCDQKGLPYLSHKVGLTPFDMNIAAHGRRLYGYEWAGASASYTSQHRRVLLVLNRTLGYLRKQGLIERLVDIGISGKPSSFGVWVLTDAGRDLMGLPSQHDTVGV